MEKDELEEVIKDLAVECNNTTIEYGSESPGTNVVFEVLQKSDLIQYNDIAIMLASFYEINYKYEDEKHYLLKPTAEAMQQNIENYPILIARAANSNKILGILTLKFHDNTNGIENIYYPYEKKGFELSGFLADLTNNQKGLKNLGKKITEIAILGLHTYRKKHPETYLSCEIDSRNFRSYNALQSGVSKVNEKSEDNITAYVESVYIHTDVPKQGKTKLQDVPILVFDIDPMHGRSNNDVSINLDFNDKEDWTDKEITKYVWSVLSSSTYNCISHTDKEYIANHFLLYNININNFKIERNKIAAKTKEKEDFDR